MKERGNVYSKNTANVERCVLTRPKLFEHRPIVSSSALVQAKFDTNHYNTNTFYYGIVTEKRVTGANESENRPVAALPAHQMQT